MNNQQSQTNEKVDTTTNKNQLIKISKIKPVSEAYSITREYALKSFFVDNRVNEGKDYLLHERIKTLIKNKGLSNSEFYKLSGISRQHYYLISYGLQKCSIELRVKLAKILDTDSSLIFQKNNHIKDKFNGDKIIPFDSMIKFGDSKE